MADNDDNTQPETAALNAAKDNGQQAATQPAVDATAAQEGVPQPDAGTIETDTVNTGTPTPLAGEQDVTSQEQALPEATSDTAEKRVESAVLEFVESVTVNSFRIAEAIVNVESYKAGEADPSDAILKALVAVKDSPFLGDQYILEDKIIRTRQAMDEAQPRLLPNPPSPTVTEQVEQMIRDSIPSGVRVESDAVGQSNQQPVATVEVSNQQPVTGDKTAQELAKPLNNTPQTTDITATQLPQGAVPPAQNAIDRELQQMIDDSEKRQPTAGLEQTAATQAMPRGQHALAAA